MAKTLAEAAPRSTTKRKKAESTSSRKCHPSQGRPSGRTSVAGGDARESKRKDRGESGDEGGGEFRVENGALSFA